MLFLQEDDEMTVAYFGISQKKDPLLKVKIREQLQHSDWELF